MKNDILSIALNSKWNHSSLCACATYHTFLMLKQVSYKFFKCVPLQNMFLSLSNLPNLLTRTLENRFFFIKIEKAFL